LGATAPRRPRPHGVARLLRRLRGPRNPRTILIDARKNRTLGENWRRFASNTSNFPFAAIVQGRNQFRFDEIGWKKVSIGLVAYLALLLVHPWLFGARPY